MANKKGKIDDVVEKVVEEVNIDETTRKKLKGQMQKEFEKYKKDVLEDNIDLYDEKPFIQKIVFIIVGIVFFPVGYALYFLINNNKKYSWQANYLVKAATVGLILFLVMIVFKFTSNIIEITIE